MIYHRSDTLPEGMRTRHTSELRKDRFSLALLGVAKFNEIHEWLRTRWEPYDRWVAPSAASEKGTIHLSPSAATARFTQTVYIVAPPKQLEPGNTCLQQERDPDRRVASKKNGAVQLGKWGSPPKKMLKVGLFQRKCHEHVDDDLGVALF